MTELTREDLAETVAELVNALAVPMSVMSETPGSPTSMLMSKVREPWAKLHGAAGFGWHSKDEYADAYNKIMKENDPDD